MRSAWMNKKLVYLCEVTNTAFKAYGIVSQTNIRDMSFVAPIYALVVSATVNVVRIYWRGVSSQGGLVGTQ